MITRASTKSNSKPATKSLEFTLTQVVLKDAGDECIIEGYANTSTKDRVGDVVLPSAFEKSLPTYLKNPVLLVNHDWTDVGGVTQQAQITDKGLYIKARISDTRGDIKTLVREGCLRTFSIGYNELDADYDESTKTKVIKELELLEISVVSVPANTEAVFTTAETKKPEDAPAAEPEAEAAKADSAECDCGECEKCDEKKSVNAGNLKSFIDTVKEFCGDELDNETVIELCGFFIQNGDLMKMTKKQLIEALRTAVKSAPAAAPSTEQKPEAAKTDEAKPQADQGQPDMMKEVMAKLDAIAQALAQILETDKQEEAKPEDKPEDKPADAPEEGKSTETPAGAVAELTDEEIEKNLADIDQQLADLEDKED